MSVKLLTEHHLELLSLKSGYTWASDSTLVKMPHCWKSYVTAQLILNFLITIKRIKPNKYQMSHYIVHTKEMPGVGEGC